MKIAFKALCIVLTLCLICICFAACSESSSERGDSKKDAELKTKTRVNELVQQIEENNALQTYKNTLVLYDELIKLEPDNIDWYVGRAQAYAFLGKSSRYKQLSEDIITRFPEDATGYIMLIKYYATKGRDKKVITTYNEAPDNIQNDQEFLSIYQQSEWTYRLRGSRCESLGAFYNDRAVFSRKELYGYKKSSLYSSLAAKFTEARPFIEDYAAVLKDDEWYFIDKDGYRVLATYEKFEDLYSLSEGYAVAKTNGKYGYIDSTFKKYLFEYDDATSFYRGVAAVKKDNKWALIDKNFKLITDFIYDDVVRDEANVCSREGVIFLRINGAYHMVGVDGKNITYKTFSNANVFYSQYASVESNGKWGFIDTKGNVVIDFAYENASSFASDMAAVKQNGKWGCVTLDGTVVLPFEYDDVFVASNDGVVAVKIKNRYKFAQFIKFTVE